MALEASYCRSTSSSGGGEKQDIVETQLPSQPALQISELLTTANNNHQWLESISDDHIVDHNSPSVAAVGGMPASVEHKVDIIMPEGVCKQSSLTLGLVVDKARYKMQGSSEDLSFTEPLEVPWDKL